MRRIFVVGVAVILAPSSGFVMTPSAARSCELRSAARSCPTTTYMNEDGPITPEGVARYRERARLRSNGAPQSEWSKTTDREMPEGWGEHEPRPPTPEQEAAVNELFEKTLTDQGLPPNFGEGIERLARPEDDRQQRPGC